MAKRSADTERIGYEKDFESSTPSTDDSQNQRATAARLAARNYHYTWIMFSPAAKKLLNRTLPNDMRLRIARPRGGRRPAPQARPVGANASPLSQSQSFPAPSWGAPNSATPADTQQPTNGFSFGQSVGPFSHSLNPTDSSDNQTSSQSSSFPPFGGFNSNFGQQANAPSSVGFNFAAPTTVNNPFASLNQNLNSQTTTNGISGSVFNTPAKKTATLHERAEEQAQEADPQSFFVAHAPFKWGQPDQPLQDQAQRTTPETNSTGLGPQNPQTSTTPFGQNEPTKKDATNIFGHLQQPSASSPNHFPQHAGQQSQTSNLFGQQSASLFQLQSNQTPSDPFAKLSAAQNQTSSNLFNKPTTSPTKDGDSMSTTPDTSPQSQNDRDRYGAFASVTAAPKPLFTIGSTPSGSGSNLFTFPPSNPANDQSGTPNALEANSNNPNDNAEPEDSGNAPSDISLGSPKKIQGATSNRNREIAQPTMGDPHIEEKTPAKNPFAGVTWKPSNSASSNPSFTFSGASNPVQSQTNASSRTSTNNSTTLFGATSTNKSDAQNSAVSRQPGVPPPTPDDFTDEQKRQFITGWRLKSLDKGLQIYLEYSSYSEEEIESISTFYYLRKQAILDANGGPVKEISNKRTAEADGHQGGPQSKKARRQPPAATSEQSIQTLRTTSTGKGNASKRKAAEELGKGNGQTQSDGAKRSKPEDQVTYPSLPPSSSSQTAKMFGNLVGRKSDEGLSNAGDSVANGNLLNGVPRPDTISTPVGSSESALFFQAPNSSSGHINKQNPSFDFSAGAASASLQPKSMNQDASNQSLSSQSSSPFKGFFPSQSSQDNSTPPASTNLLVPSSHRFDNQSTNNSSIFSSLDRENAEKSNAKRKANTLNRSEVPQEEVSEEESEGQRSKKQRTQDVPTATTDSDKENVDISTPPSTTERAGFGESIFSRPGMLPTNNSNIFSHLGNLANEQGANDADDDADEADDDDGRHRKTRKGAKKTNASVGTNQASGFSKSNAFSSTVFNPFAGKTFDTPKRLGDEEKTPGRSLFDRIERDPKGEPIKAPPDLKNVDFGQSILKTPRVGGPLDRTSQAPSSNIFGATSSVPGDNALSNTGAKATGGPPAATSAFNLFGKPSGSNAAPMANMTGPKDGGDSPGSDHTWKAGTPVKFSETSGAPSINFTSPSPSKTPLSGLFGAPKASTTTETPGSFIFKPFDASATKPAPLTFGISAPAKDSLAPPSETQSESTSRATSPGAGESGNEASDQVHEEESHPDLDTTEASKAEADEDTIFEVKAKAHKQTESKHFNATTGKDEVTRPWVLQGAEQFRILKHRETKKTRMLMKLKVNGRVILNAGLEKSLNYVLASSKTVRVPVPTETKVESWTIQVGKEADAKELARLLEENKAN
ncbi:MAG: hypothetical protein Q9171_005114 [Xanthocarpia ochracea]